MRNPLPNQRRGGRRIRTLLSERSATLLHRSSIRRPASFTLGGGSGGYEGIRQQWGHTSRHEVGKSMETRGVNHGKKMH
jgi:hypothetical protein